MPEPSETTGDQAKAPANNAVEKTTVTSGKSSYVSYVIMIVCLVAAAISLIYYFTKVDKSGTAEKGTEGESAVGNLIDGNEYLIYLKSVEVQPQKANGKPWDNGNSAPDVFYQVLWKGNQVYQSETMDDSLIADWIPVGLSLKDSILSGQVSVDQAIKLPKVKCDNNTKNADEVIFKIIDNDLLSGNDHIQDVSLLLSKLRLGDNTVDFDDKAKHNLIKMVVRIVDNNLSADEKIQAIMRSR
jgi:hypothetical protein